jgi:hypothetical protein
MMGGGEKIPITTCKRKWLLTPFCLGYFLFAVPWLMPRFLYPDKSGCRNAVINLAGWFFIFVVDPTAKFIASLRE